MAQGKIRPVKNYAEHLQDMLFELNHVRVNPRLDNAMIIKKLTDAFSDIGVKVRNAPKHNTMAICFKPLGEMSHNVRFYIKGFDANVVFLSPAIRPMIVGKTKKGGLQVLR